MTSPSGRRCRPLTRLALSSRGCCGFRGCTRTPRRPPTKALSENTDLMSDFWLADRLKMPVREIRDMPNEEYVYWSVYHGIRVQQEQLQAKAVRRGKGK